MLYNVLLCCLKGTDQQKFWLFSTETANRDPSTKQQKLPMP